MPGAHGVADRPHRPAPRLRRALELLRQRVAAAAAPVTQHDGVAGVLALALGEDAGGQRAPAARPHERARHGHLDAELEQPAPGCACCSIVFTVHAETQRLGRDQRDLAALARQQLGQHAAHVVVVVVEDDARARRRAARPAIRSSGVSTCMPASIVERAGVPAADAVAAPARAGRDRDVVEAVGERLVGGQPAAERRPRRWGAARAGRGGSRRTRIHAASPGSRASRATRPPSSSPASASTTS